MDKFVSQSKKSISVSQLLGSMTPSYSLSDLNEEMKQTSLKKLTSNRVMDLSANMMESASNKMKFLNLNDPSNLPLDKKLLDFVMHVKYFLKIIFYKYIFKICFILSIFSRTPN